MELRIHFQSLPADMTLESLKAGLDDILEDDGWLTGSGADYVELELEDERMNPKYGIMAVKSYLQRARFAPDTTIELAGVPVGGGGQTRRRHHTPGRPAGYPHGDGVRPGGQRPGPGGGPAHF